MSLHWGQFFFDSSAGWGSNLDMIALSHGPVGCGAFAQSIRLNPPGLIQGIESFTAFDTGTNVTERDLEDGGDRKLARALDEAKLLFPLAPGVTILSEDPVALIDANIREIAKQKSKQLNQLIVPVNGGATGGSGPAELAATATALKTAADYRGHIKAHAYDVALPYCRGATGLVWIVSKLLRNIGLNPVHELTGSSSEDMARVSKCKYVIGFAHQLDVPSDYLPKGPAQFLRRWYGLPIIWSSFLNPVATAESLRLIARHFDYRVQRRVEIVIEFNRKKIEATVARYRPRLEGKLVLNFGRVPEAALDCYRMLGMRVGNINCWPGKTGVERKPRLVLDGADPSEKAIDSYIAEAKPDLVLYFERNEFDWVKRGIPALPYSALFDDTGNGFWGYDGFCCLAAALDRRLNAPWRKLLKPPWHNESR